MKPSEARNLLIEQHNWLRRLLVAVERVTALYLVGSATETDVDVALDELRRAFSRHNESEEALLEPMLSATDAWGPQRIARMVEEHVGEHAAFRQALSAPVADLVPRLAELAEELEAHMLAEERTFLSPQVLRDDLVTLGSCS